MGKKKHRRRKHRNRQSWRPPGLTSLLHESVRTELVSLEDLADSDGLPANHPLRSQAASLLRAFRAVTSGPVEPNTTRLLDVPHTSPLANWKRLVRAIEYFHRGDDESCRRATAGIDEDSPPHRAVSVLQTMLAGQALTGLHGAGAILAKRLRGNSATELRSALEDLEKALDVDNSPRPEIRRGIAGAFKACLRFRPDQLPELQRRCTVRTLALGWDIDSVLNELKRPLEADLDFYRLAARAVEPTRHGTLASVFWECFLRLGRLEEDPSARPQAAAVLQRMATLAAFFGLGNPRTVASRVFTDLSSPACRTLFRPLGLSASHKDSVDVLEPLFRAPRLYARLCEVAPDDEHFGNWCRHLRETGADWKELDTVCRTWSVALPRSWQPWAERARLAAQRKAYATAVKHLDAALQLEPGKPELKLERRGCLAGQFYKHMHNFTRLHLARKDLEELVATPAGDEFGSAMESIFRWALETASGDFEEAQNSAAEAMDELGDAAGKLLINAVARETKVGPSELPGRFQRSTMPPVNEALPGLFRALDQGRIYKVPIYCLLSWEPLLTASLKQESKSMPVAELIRLCKTANAMGLYHLAYVASGLGLARREWPAHFLFHRSLSMGWGVPNRHRTCWRLACALAKDDDDINLLDQMEMQIAARQSRAPYYGKTYFEFSKIAYTDDELEEVVRTENARTAVYPPNGRWSSKFDVSTGAYKWKHPSCDCEVCRQRRETAAREEFDSLNYDYDFDDDDDFEDDDFDDDFEDDDDFDDDHDESPPDPPPIWAVERFRALCERHVARDGSFPTVEELYELEPREMTRLDKDLDRFDRDGTVPSRTGPGVQDEGRRLKARAARKKRKKAKKRGRRR